MLYRAFLFATLVASAPQVSNAQRPAPGDSALLLRVAQAETQFFRAWRDAWRDSLGKVIPDRVFTFERDPRSVGYLNSTRCAADRSLLQLNIIRSAGNGQAVCPWYADEETTGRYGFPAKAGPSGVSARAMFRVEPTVRAVLTGALLSERQTLVALLDSAVRTVPSNAGVVGQRVRFLLDDNDLAVALRVARECVANRWWCSALTGYVLYQAGNIAGADSAFQAATAATTGKARCDWTDVRTLLGETRGQYMEGSLAPLDTAARATYDRLPCTRRDSVNTTVMWLADPFWGDAVNERRVENYARKVALFLRTAVSQDELYNWQAAYGGDALAELVLRYGWPSRAEWAGKGNDEVVDAYLRTHGQNALPGTPYLTAEYGIDRDTTVHAYVSQRKRLHFVPAWNVVMDPFHAPRNGLAVMASENYPWSAEHMPAPRPITQIVVDQSVLLRRQSNVLLAYASHLGATSMNLRIGDTVSAVVVRSTRPDSFQQLGAQRVGATARLFVREPIPSEPAIISVELPNEGDKVGARARFAVAPPPTLAQMTPGEVAISEPLILQSPVGDEILPNEPEAALRRMSGTTRLQAELKTIGVYWETYGLAPGDSVEIAIRVQRYTAQSALEKVGIALNMRGDKNSPVSLAWTEPQLGHAAHVTAGPVPIVSRSIVLNIASLSKGDYWLDIGVHKNGQEPVVGRRSFVVQ